MKPQAAGMPRTASGYSGYSGHGSQSSDSSHSSHSSRVTDQPSASAGRLSNFQSALGPFRST